MKEEKIIFDNLLKLPKSTYEVRQRGDYLEKTFTGRPSEFCYFMGYMRVELANNRKINKVEAVSIMDDIAMTALKIGREDGRVYAIRNYAPNYKFLIKENEATA